MSKITIHAGDFHKGDASLMLDQIAFPFKWTEFFKVKTLPVTDITELAVASEESVKRMGGTVGWGIAGAALLGPVGLLAGLLLGGKRNNVTFTAVFKDGRKMLATTDAKTYTKLTAANFK